MGLLGEVRVITMMDGSRQTFIKRGGGSKKIHRWDFRIADAKMEEFVDFVERYRGSKFRVNWRGETFVGKITNNPIEPQGVGREYYKVTLELVEV